MSASRVTGADGRTAVGRRPHALPLLLLVVGLFAVGSPAADPIGPDAGDYEGHSIGFAWDGISGTGTRILDNHDDSTLLVPIGFSFEFYGRDYSQVFVSSNGLLSFDSGVSSPGNVGLQSSVFPDVPVIAPLWDDWRTDTDANAAVYYRTEGSPGSRRFIVQWDQVRGFSHSPSSVTFQAMLLEGSRSILFRYLDTESGDFRNFGGSATVGIRDRSGHLNGRNLQWSFNQPVISSHRGILFGPCQPRVVHDSYSVRRNRELAVPAPGVLANDVNCRRVLTAALETPPAHGELTLNADGSFTYVPTAHYTGPDGFRYRLLEGPVNWGFGDVRLEVFPGEHLGVVVNHRPAAAVVFDADTHQVVGRVTLPTDAVFDCVITADGTTALVTDFSRRIWALDLRGTPRLADAPNPIPLETRSLDVSLTPDQRFALVSNGSIVGEPISVVDVAARTVADTFRHPLDSNSVEALGDGSVLFTANFNFSLHRLTIGGDGRLAHTGESVLMPFRPVNVFSTPDGASALVLSMEQVLSYRTQGPVPVDRRRVSGAIFGSSGAAHPAGDRIYVRGLGLDGFISGAIDMFGIDPNTAALSPAPIWTALVPPRIPFFGVEQLALFEGRRLYAPVPGGVRVLDAGNGATLREMADPALPDPAGVAVQPNVLRAALGRRVLGPPVNHRLVDVGVQFSTSFDREPNPTIGAHVYSDEDDEAQSGDGRHSPDARWEAPGILRLRQERKGNGAGRVYLVVVTATDRWGNSRASCSSVVVPRSASPADLREVQSRALAAETYFDRTGTPPPGFYRVGDGPVLGPHQ